MGGIFWPTAVWTCDLKVHGGFSWVQTNTSWSVPARPGIQLIPLEVIVSPGHSGSCSRISSSSPLDTILTTGHRPYHPRWPPFWACHLQCTLWCHAVWGCSLGVSWAEVFPFNQLMGSLGAGMAATLLSTEAATGKVWERQLVLEGQESGAWELGRKKIAESFS